METESIRFLEFREPDLDVGEYRFQIEQKIEGQTFTTTDTYAVFGDRFSIPPDAIHAFFPPDGALGEYTAVMPHISLKKSTFPWERSPFQDNDGDGWPWLTLLILDEEELRSGSAKAPRIVTLKELIEGEENTSFPKTDLETSQNEQEKTVVVDVQRSLLEQILPTEQEMKQLAHVRKRTSDGRELAVIMGNRLPKKGSNTTVHLISIEGRFQFGKGFDYQDASPETFIRFVSLKQWEFACPEQFLITEKNLQTLQSKQTVPEPILLKLKETARQGKIINGKVLFTDYLKTELGSLLKDVEESTSILESIANNSLYSGDFEQLIENLNTGELSIPWQGIQKERLRSYLQRGFVPLPHTLRQGDKTYSWFHGPFVPFQQERRLQSDGSQDLPDFADSLTEYDPSVGMFDVSYSSAYQLGKMLALKETIFAKALFQWKSAYNQVKALEAQQKEVDELIGNKKASDDQVDQQTLIRKRMGDLALLENVPFSYLVADDAMFPEESIRFFTIDPYWVECLQYGAFTIGGNLRTLSKTPKEEELKVFYDMIPEVGTVRTGFLLRSKLISGWPDIQVEAFDTDLPKSELTAPVNAEKLEILRIDKLAPDVLLCIVSGDIKVVDLFLKPEGLRYGVDEKSDGTFNKDLMFQNGETLSIPIRKDQETRVIDIEQVIENLQAITPNVTSAKLGMEMIDGSGKGRFLRNNATD